MNRVLKPGKFLLIVASLLVAASQAQAQNGLVKTEWPTMEDPGIPFYARVEIYEPYIFNDGEWAAIIFYRDPACVPDDFNLLLLLDLENLGNGELFKCEHTVNGVSLWSGEAFNGAPKVINMTGNGMVPIWFVPWEEVASQAQEGGTLTMQDLMKIEDLSIGYASRFNERLHPHADPAFGGGGHPNPKMIVTASGLMEDGRSFDLHIVWINDVVRSIDIRFD